MTMGGTYDSILPHYGTGGMKIKLDVSCCSCLVHPKYCLWLVSISTVKREENWDNVKVLCLNELKTCIKFFMGISYFLWLVSYVWEKTHNFKSKGIKTAKKPTECHKMFYYSLKWMNDIFELTLRNF